MSSTVAYNGVDVNGFVLSWFSPEEEVLEAEMEWAVTLAKGFGKEPCCLQRERSDNLVWKASFTNSLLSIPLNGKTQRLETQLSLR